MACFKSHSECGFEVSVRENHQDLIPTRSNNFDLNLAEDEVLTQSDFDKIQKDPGISAVLASNRVQLVLRRLNFAKDRRKSFRKLCSSSSTFANLVHQIDAALRA
jgi:hypothetical protein